MRCDNEMSWAPVSTLYPISSHQMAQEYLDELVRQEMYRLDTDETRTDDSHRQAQSNQQFYVSMNSTYFSNYNDEER